MPLFDVIKKNPFKCDLDHLLERINPYVIKLWNFISFTSFLESASHTKAATAIPALLCTIAALKEKKNMHWAFYTWQTFLNWENYGQEWYSLRSYGSWCQLMPSWRMPCTVMTTWFFYCLYNYVCFILILLFYRDDTIFVWHNCACTTSSSPLTGGGSFPPKRGFSSLTRYHCNIS